MRKVYTKLIVMALALTLAVTVVIMSSYAWLVLSGNPAVTGIQVAIGGGNTILTAPNIQEVDKDGNVYSYPGYFSDKLNFGQVKEYEYLRNLGSLTPVSTYNGIDWFLPTYYSGSDPEVQNGKIPSGYIKDISEFTVESELEHANLSKKEKDKISEGSYIYLDFWVVAPGGDYTLRVSTGEGTDVGGSFVVDLMEPTESETVTGYKLEAPEGSAAAAVRVGFLANDVGLTDNTMKYYSESKYFDERFHSLRGVYKEPSTGTAYLDADRFTIYEPNGDLHPAHKDLNGHYVETSPLALVQGSTIERSIRDRVTVQRTSSWAVEGDATEVFVEQLFQTALYKMDVKDMTPLEIMDKFYGNYLQGQISPYIQKGDFIKETSELYQTLRNNNNMVTKEQLQNLEHAGATDGIYIIKLERNVPQRIRMFIWLEGQDVDCVKIDDATCFAVNIELAGGSE